MLNYENQLNLGNIYSECSEMFKEQRPEFLELLNKYIDINTYIPFSFKKAFYANTGRPRGCSLYGYISALVDITEPICKKINSELANMLSYDTSAVESYVTENNPKYLNSTINKLKAYYKFKDIDKSNDDIYKQAFKSLPKNASSDSSIRKMYANRAFLLW